MTSRATLRVTMESDWHVGTGRGRSGGVDASVARDADGFPYLPAKTLTGILRDRAEAVAAALDGDAEDGWVQRCTRLFGSQPALDRSAAGPPEPARVAVRAGLLAAPVRAALGGGASGRPVAGLTFVKPGVAIDPVTRQARTDALRMIEMARLGAVLEAPVELADDLDDHDHALLLAATLLVDRVGGDRRRGAGRCRMELDGTGLRWDRARVLLDSQPPEPTSPGATPVTAADSVPTRTDSGVASERLDLVLRLRSPVLARARVIGNTVESHDVVPGTTVLAALAPRLQAAGCDLGAAIAAGRLVVSDAVPDVGGVAGLPASLALQRVKDGDGFAAEGGVRNSLADVREPGTVTTQVRGGHLGPFDGTSLPVFVGSGRGRVAATHNTINDDLQRPDATVGGVFTYEAIAAGTVLHVRIELVGEPAVLAVLGADLRADPSLRLGTSKKDGYGDVQVVSVSPADPPPATQVDATCTAWCASDVVLVNEALRPTTSAADLASAVAHALGVEADLDEESVFIRSGRRDGFQGSWGLPRGSLVTIAAGSTIRLRLLSPSGPVPTEVHVGERIAEGFGRIVVQHPLLSVPLAGLGPALATAETPAGTTARPPETDRPLRDDEVAYVVAVAAAQWQERILERTYELVDAAGPRHAPTTNAQIGALREALRRLGPWAPDNPGRVWHAAAGSVANRQALWPDATWTLLGSVFDDPDRIWQLLGPADWPTPTAPPDADSQLRHRLWGDAVRTLLSEAARAGALAGLTRLARPATREAS